LTIALRPGQWFQSTDGEEGVIGWDFSDIDVEADDAREHLVWLVLDTGD
jgi:hypothetical protein